MSTRSLQFALSQAEAFVATLAVAAVVFAALMLAVLVEDRYQKSVGPTEEAVEDKHDFLPNSVTADNGLFLLCLKIDLRKTASMETDRSNV